MARRWFFSDRQLAWLALFYFVFNALSQLFISTTVDIDQSEQMLLSQQLQLGYNAQPPLYTYCVWLIFKLFGVGIYQLTLFKALLLSALAWVMLAIGREFRFSPQQQFINLVGLACIPQIIWHSQRDMTHSALVTLVAAATLWQLLRLYRSPTLLRYLELGVLVAAGLLSKYNYLFFISALTLSVLILPRYRHLALNGRAAIALLLSAMLVLPHLGWALENLTTAVSGLAKVRPAANQFGQGLLQACIQLVTFCAPIVLFGPAVWLGKRKLEQSDVAKKRYAEQAMHLPLLGLTTMIILIIMVGFIYLSDAQVVKERWFQPLYFYFPLLIALWSRNNLSTKVYRGVAVFLLLLAMVLLPMRTVLGGYIDKIDRPSMPYPDIMGVIRIVHPEASYQYIVADNQLVGGNAYPFFGEKPVFAPNFPKLHLELPEGEGLVICRTEQCDQGGLPAWLASKGLALEPSTMQRYSHPYYFAAKKGKMTLYTMRVKPL